jgi:cell division transport system permease protein
VVAAILVFLACIAALGARGAWQQAENWTSDLETNLTVQIRPVIDSDVEADAQQAADLIATLDGVEQATARDRAYAEALVAPWLGSGNIPEDLPLPLLVQVRLSTPGSVSVSQVQTLLDNAGLAASVDDHGQWAQAVRRAASFARTLALSLLALLTGAAAAVVAFAARASLAARVDVIDALHLSGAEDRFIATLFQRRFFMLGLKAGTAGALIAVLVSLLVSSGGSSADMAFFLPRWSTNPFELIMLGVAPLLAGATSALSARLAVSTDLRGRW